MKRKSTKKRTYWNFFLRTFAVLLAFAAALETAVVIYKKKSKENEIAEAHDPWDIEVWLCDAKESEITETAIRELLARRCNSQYWIDNALVLYDRQEDRIYDSSRILLAKVIIDADTPKKFDVYKEAAKEHPDTLHSDTLEKDEGFRKTFISDDPGLLANVIPFESPDWNFILNADEIYAQGDTLKLGLFNVKHYQSSGRRKMTETANPSYNLTQEARSSGDCVHFVKPLAQNITEDADALRTNSLTVCAVGSRTDSPALAEAYRYMNWNHGDYSINPPGGYQKVDVPAGYTCIRFDSIKLPIDKQPNEDFRWELYIVNYYNFFQAYMQDILSYSSILLVIVLILSVMIATIRHLKYSKVYEMNEYRRGLTAALAHDLKTPLTAISGYAENLRESVHTEKRDEYADAILENAQYMDSLIADVLSLAKLEQQTDLQKKKTDLTQLAKDAAGRLSAATDEKAVTVQLSGKCEAAANEKIMAQAIANLISNAVRYTPQGGCIDITGTEQGLQIRNDTNADIPDVKVLSEPFVKGDDARDTRAGSGMGLAIVRQICALHGFRLDLSAKDGKFTAVIRFR